MEVEKSFQVEAVEARGALCVECLGEVGAGEALVDRTGAALCRGCAAEFYSPCAGCGGLVPRDETVTRAADGAEVCVECHARGAAAPDVEAGPAKPFAWHSAHSKAPSPARTSASSRGTSPPQPAHAA